MAAELPLKLEPSDVLVFAGAKLGEEAVNLTLKITNPTADRYAFKVKCTSNEMFRIRPVIGVLKAKEETTVMLGFNAGKSVPESGKHYFAVYAVKAADESKSGRQTWQEHKGDPDGQKKVFVEFKKGDGEKEEDETKADEKKEEVGEEKKEDEKKPDDKKDEKPEEKKDE